MTNIEEEYKVDFDLWSKLYDYEVVNQVNDIKFYISLLKLYRPSTVLEVGVGTGRIMSKLKEIFNDIKFTGIDISKGMIEVCNNKINKKNNVELIVGDILTYELNKQFEFIFIPINTVCHFNRNDIHIFFEKISKVCNAGGILCMDIFNPDMIIDNKGRMIEVIEQDKEFFHNNFIVNKERYSHVQSCKIDNNLQEISVDNRYISDKEIIRNNFKLYYYNIEEIISIGSKYNFGVYKDYGNYDFTSFDKNLSERIVVLFYLKK